MSYLSDFLGDAYKEGMTEEELSTVLETAISNVSKANATEITSLKNRISAVNSEAAEYKRQLRGKQTEDEKRTAEQLEQMKTLSDENAELKRTIALADYTSKYLEKGYDREIATATAEALMNGDLDTVLENQSKFVETREAEIKAELMKGTHRPRGGATSVTMTAKDFHKLSFNEKYEWMKAHPEEYAAMYKES